MRFVAFDLFFYIKMKLPEENFTKANVISTLLFDSSVPPAWTTPESLSRRLTAYRWEDVLPVLLQTLLCSF